MRRATALLAALLAVLLAAAAAAIPAGATTTQEAWLQDDDELLHNDPAKVERRLDEVAALGVDRLRITLVWAAVAPSPGSRRRPRFDATDPDAYPPGAWSRYDRLLREAAERGLEVNVNVTGPSPVWANGPSPRHDIRRTYEPSPGEFAQFVVAAGRRYDGGGGLPRVDHWAIWNEPNHSGWLTPTWGKAGKRSFERSAVLYRQLLHAGYAGLAVTGHGSDTILIGETAPTGSDRRQVKTVMKPLVFVRALYCVNRRLRPVKGRRAKLLGCESSRSAFRKANPALFAATGFSHHPYQLLTAPNVKPRDKDVVTMAVLPRLTRALDRILRGYGVRRRLPLYLSEYGYQTPPDPLGVPFLQQSAYLNQSEWMASRNRRVRAIAQFLLVDDGAPVRRTFQSGLIDRRGRLKPAYPAYRLPVWVSGKGSRKKVWAVLRPAPDGARQRARIEYRPRRSRRYRPVRVVRSRGVRNVVSARVRARRGGSLRVVYGDYVSRTVPVG